MKANTSMTTTKAKRRATHDYGLVTTAWVVGSTLATLAGTRLLAAQEPAPTPAIVTEATQGQQIRIAPLDLSADSLGLSDAPILLDLPPIPSALNAPQAVSPVARSRSSR